MKNPLTGKVALIGAGPGDPELLTLRALKAIEQADVVVYDRLVSPEILALVPAHIRRIDVGKMPKFHTMPQEAINELLVSLALQGHNVARLKGGDPMIFGRGSEEAAALREAGISVTYVPGITAAQGAAASTGVPLTHRGLATGVRYVTGHRAKDQPLDLDWSSLASEATTLVVYMGAANIAEIADQLMAHRPARGTSGADDFLRDDAARKADCFRAWSHCCRCGRADLEAPVLFIIGHVVSLYGDRAMDEFARDDTGGCLCLGVLAIAWAATALAAPDAVAQDAKRLEHIVTQDCGSCHGLTLKGGLGRPITPQALADADPETIAGIILDGVPGTAMPPWRPLITEDEALWMANYLKSGKHK